MTAPTGVPATPRTNAPWYARPRIVLSILGAVVVASALLAREPLSGRSGDPRLSAFSTDPLGARLLHDLAGRLGWRVTRAQTNPVPATPDAVLAVLDPTETITPREAHAMLQHVRRGGAMLLVLGDGTSALSDSLRITVGTPGGTVDTRAGAAERCESTTPFARNGLWIGQAALFPLEGAGMRTPGAEPLVYVRQSTRQTGNQLRPAMQGMPFGSGRIVVAADPDVFRNDALRECRYGLDVPAVRALEYLAAGGVRTRTALVFDELHQARARTSGIQGAVRRYLSGTPSGHALLQLMAAGCILLLALAPRLLVPRDETRVVRRSPLEHVDALARAYEQVRASRTATGRLVRGLRRRVGRGTQRMRTAESDEDFLDRIATSVPALKGDAALVRDALAATLPPDRFQAVGQAISRIESTLTGSPQHL